MHHAKLARTSGPWRLIAIYLMGCIAGIQGGLYLADIYDDGIADWRSGVIAIVLVLLGTGLLVQTIRRHKRV